jgi:hypothetical protein
MTHDSDDIENNAPIFREKTSNTVTSDIEIPSRQGITKFGTSDFTTFINSLYIDPVIASNDLSKNPSFKRMQDNVTYLLSRNCYSKNISEQNSITKIKWGYYQTMLAAAWQCTWPGNTWLQWQKSVPKVRKSLEKVPNYQGIDGQEDCQTPFKSRCELLDALIQRCFNEPASGQKCPGIPMTIKVSGKCRSDPTNEFHDIRFHWDLDSDGVPILLHLTMICPFGS